MIKCAFDFEHPSVSFWVLLMSHQHCLHPPIPGYHLCPTPPGKLSGLWPWASILQKCNCTLHSVLEFTVEIMSLFSFSHKFQLCFSFFHFVFLELVSSFRAWIYFLQKQTPTVLDLNTEVFLFPDVLLQSTWCSRSEGWTCPGHQPLLHLYPLLSQDDTCWAFHFAT